MEIEAACHASTCESWGRALRIMNTLIKALEARGYPVETGQGYKARTHARVDDERVEFRVQELQRQVMRESEFSWSGGRDECRALEPTGQLMLVIDEYAEGVRKTWKDGKRQRVEDCLNAFVVSVVAVAEVKKERTLRLARQRREREEARRLRLAEERRSEAEAARGRVLEQEAGAWSRAGQIRAYLEAVLHAASEPPGDELAAWLTWARRYADEIDPIPVRAQLQGPVDPNALT